MENNFEDLEYDYRKRMPKKEKRQKRFMHKIQVIRGRKESDGKE